MNAPIRAAHAGIGMQPMECRPHCAACCIAPSISSPIPGMPQGKPAGVCCVQLDQQGRCKLFGRPERPAVCRQLMPSIEMCGPVDDGGRHAMHYLARLERATAPRHARKSGQ
jgi:Fe-S-cluster containining protein